ncbi:hypothetical protein ACLB2K_030712 [Fragaria x ananassa]
MATSNSSVFQLSNDEVGLILNSVTNLDDRKAFSEVCKQWITDQGLGFLANGPCSKTLKTLVLTGCRGITDSGAVPLHKMAFLEELYLVGETGFSLDGLRAVAMIQTLKKPFVLHVESFEWVI